MSDFFVVNLLPFGYSFAVLRSFLLLINFFSFVSLVETGALPDGRLIHNYIDTIMAALRVTWLVCDAPDQQLGELMKQGESSPLTPSRTAPPRLVSRLRSHISWAGLSPQR